jgi:hypothetical protein
MRHITVPGFGLAPCGGHIQQLPRPADYVSKAAACAVPETSALPLQDSIVPRRLTLPILAQSPVQPAPPVTPVWPIEPPSLWRCDRCGLQWEEEPLPDEAL